MSNRSARKLRRREERDARNLRENTSTPERLQATIEKSRRMMDLAAESLGLDEQRALEIKNSTGEMTDVLLARALELMVLAHGYETVSVGKMLDELEQRNGPGFLARVAAMGRPAAAMLALIACLVLLLTPEGASAQTAQGARFETVSYANLRAWLLRWLGRCAAFLVRNSRSARPGKYRHPAGGKCTLAGRRSGAIWWSRSSAGFGLRSTSHQLSAVGCGRGRTSSSALVSASRSSWFGAGTNFERTNCRRTTRTLRSSTPTVRWNARAGARTHSSSKPAAESGCRW